MKRVISLALVAIFCLALAACGAPGHDFTCADVVDSSKGQQRWLKSYESNLVINPQAIGAEEYTDANGKLGLDVGVTDAEGNIVKTLDDVIFLVEPHRANGVGGDAVFTAVFAGDGVNTSGLNKASYNGSDGTYMNVTTGTDNFSVKAPKYQLTLDNVTEYYLVIDASVVGNEIKVQGTFNNPFKTEEIGVITAPGTYIYDINSIGFEDDTPGSRKFTPILDIKVGKDKEAREVQYVINEFSIKTFPAGGAYGTKAMSSTWYPYQIVSSQEYVNGTSFQTEDMITSATAITRIVTVNTDGMAFLGGYLNGGTAEYNDKDISVTVKGEGYEFTVACSRRGTVVYYDSEEDMLAGINGSTEYKATSKYWALDLGGIKTGESFNVGVSASVTGEDTADAAKEASRNATVKKFKSNAETAWDEFIATNDMYDYMENIPEDK